MRKVQMLMTIGTSLAAAAFNSAAARAASAVREANYRLDAYALQINGETQFVNALQGGFVDGVVATDDTTSPMPGKHLVNSTVEPVRARIQADQFATFLASSLDGTADAATATVYYLDNSNTVRLERALHGVRLSELTVPTLSGSPTPADMSLTVGLSAESSQTVDPLAGALPPVKSQDTGPGRSAKRWTGMWKFEMPGLPTNRISKIESFSLRRPPTTMPAGTIREPMIQPSQWQVPNLVFYMPPQDSQAWLAWHDDFVVQGNHTDAAERTFTLQLLSADLKNVLLELDGSGVGIVSAKYEQPITANAPTGQGFRVELYVESMRVVSQSAPSLSPPLQQQPQVPSTVPVRLNVPELRHVGP